MATTEPPSYIDFAPLTTPTFSPHHYANTLLLSTTHPSDPLPLDLSVPLSRVLFDVQEIDTRIDTLTTANAAQIVQHTAERKDASERVLEGVEEAVRALSEGYERLRVEVQERYEAAERVRVAAERMAMVMRVGRGVQRCLQLGRGLEGALDRGVEGMVPAAETLLLLRRAFEEEAEAGRVLVVQSLRSEVVGPAERGLVGRAQGVVREFSMSSLLLASNLNTGGGGGQQTYAQSEDMKSRATSALQTLYLLSPTSTFRSSSNTKPTTTSSAADFEPTLLLSALQIYLQTALTSSLASLTRALATLPTLDKTLLEISARCQNITALETLLASTKPPPHPLLSTAQSQPTNTTLLAPLLRHLDTSSLPSYFWRTLASQLSPRVGEILTRGGVSARTLRSHRERVGGMIRECVDRGSGGGKGWEREAAVMVGSVVGGLGGRV